MDRDLLKGKLLDSINNKRQEMIGIANREGYTSEMTIKCSQDLDILLNEYQQMLEEERAQTIGPFQGLVRQMKLWTLAKSIHYS